MTLARGACSKFLARMTTLCLDVARGVAGAWCVLEFLDANDALSFCSACRDADTWSVVEILGSNDELFVVFGA